MTPEQRIAELEAERDTLNALFDASNMAYHARVDLQIENRRLRGENALLRKALAESTSALKDVVNYFWSSAIEGPILREGDVQSLVESAIADGAALARIPETKQ